jgi:hypothetical protein
MFYFKCPQELAFQKLIFVTMLAWKDPYDEDNDPHSSLDNYSILVSFDSSLFSTLFHCAQGPQIFISEEF